MKEEIIILAVQKMKELIKDKKQSIREQNEKQQKLIKTSHDYKNSYQYKEYLRAEEENRHRENLIKNMVNDIKRENEEKQELEDKCKKYDEMLKTICSHYWVSVSCEDDYECEKCGWYKSEI